MEPALFALPTARLVTWTWRPETERIVVPERAAAALGGALAAAFEQPSWQFVHPDDVDGLLEALQRCLHENQPIERAVRVHPDAGSSVTWLEIHATCTDTPTGPRLQGVFLDGTRRRLAEVARERHEARYRLIMDSAREYAILTMAADGTISGWSVGATRLFGYGELEALGLPSSVLFNAEDVEAGVPQQEITRALAAGRVKDERWHRRKDGTQFFGSGLLMRMDGDDESSRLVKILRDRTFEEQARRALAESQERLRLATEAAGLGVFEWNFDTGTALWENPRMYEIFGREPADGPLDAGEAADRILPEDREMALAALQAHARSGDPLHLLLRVSAPGEGPPRHLEIWGRLRADEHGERRRLIGVVADVTAAREREQALVDADHRKDAFLATLAHELRNPLAPVRHALAILRRPDASAEAAERARALMGRQLAQMVRLIDDLLDLSRITLGKISLRKAVVSVDDVVRNARETCQSGLDALNQRLEVTLPSESVHVDGDPMRLAQVVTNLLNNASKFSPAGSTIRLVVSATSTDVTCVVHDEGVGIAEEELPYIFEMFAQGTDRLHEGRGGLGVGLALVKQLVDMHGGRVHAGSDGPGLGSTFTITLPRVPAPATEPAPTRGVEVLATMKRVLVVDDNVDSAESLSLLLELMGHVVRTAHDGEQALVEAESFHPELVLMDIGMPRMDGYEAARRLRKAEWSANTVLVALTGWGQDEDKRRSEAAGFNHHLIKPVDPTALEALLGAAAD